MENYCNYNPTPEQIEASKRLDEERKERCKRINERYGIYDEQDNTGTESEDVVKLEGDNKTRVPVLPDNRRNVSKPVQKKKSGGHKKNNNASDKNDGQSSLF